VKHSLEFQQVEGLFDSNRTKLKLFNIQIFSCVCQKKDHKIFLRITHEQPQTLKNRIFSHLEWEELLDFLLSEDLKHIFPTQIKTRCRRYTDNEIDIIHFFKSQMVTKLTQNRSVESPFYNLYLELLVDL